MRANRHDRAAEAPIINTYVPINFDLLYKIGSAQKQEVEDAAKNMYDAISKFGEFYSPSDIDTENWYNNTIGKFGDLIQEVADNPDKLKDAYWRTAFNSRLYNLDYAALGRLRQSREGMIARQKANQELMIKGGYNPLLHDVDFSSYDTLGSGLIFNDVSPLAYKSVVDMVKPYVDNLKGRYLGNKNGMMYTGVTDDDTDAQLMLNWSSIENSPYYLQNLEIIKKQTGVDDATAIEMLNDKIITAGREFTWNDVLRDPLAVAMARHNGDGDTPNSSLLNLTDQLEIDAGKAFARGLGDAKSTQEVLKNIENTFKTSAATNNSFNTAINDAISLFSSEIDEDANEVLSSQNTQTGKSTKEGYRIGNSTSDFILRKRLAYNLMGKESESDNKLQDDLEKGMFKNFLVAGTPSITTDGRNIYHNKYIFIPESEILGKYTAKDIARVLGDKVTLNENQVSITESTDTYGDTRTSVNTKLKAGGYIRIPVSTIVPRSGQGAVGNDASHAKLRNIGLDMRDLMQLESENRRLLYKKSGNK